MSDTKKFAGQVVGSAICALCGQETSAKVNVKGHLYVYCTFPADGGCGGGFTARTAKADGILATKVTSWRNKEARDAFCALTPENVDPNDEAELDPEEVEETPPQNQAPQKNPDPPRRSSSTSGGSSARRAPPKAAPKKPGSWWDKEI